MSSITEKLNQFLRRKHELEHSGDKDQTGSKMPLGKLSARERIKYLLDDSTFVEIGAFAAPRALSNAHALAQGNALEEKEVFADGVITGFGSINNRLVFVYSQDSTALNGSVGEMHARKICAIYQQALKMGAPVIGFCDSSGFRVEEGLQALQAYGQIYSAMAEASGAIVQITAVMGGCMGSASFLPALSDFVFSCTKDAKLFLTSPNAMPLGSAPGENGGPLVHFPMETEQDCIFAIKNLLSYLPSNNMDDAPLSNLEDTVDRTEQYLNTCIPENIEQELDIHKIIASIADGGRFLEIQKDYAQQACTGFVHFNGISTGIIANRSKTISSKALDKMTRFLSFCDAFGIPIVTLTDAAFYEAVDNQEQLIQNGARLMSVLANASIPKINVLLRFAFGHPYLAMNSSHIGADVVFAWPTAQVGVMDPQGAVRVLYGEENGSIADKITQYKETVTNPYTAAKCGYVDDIIEPAATRKRLIAALEMLSSKREGSIVKKHSSFLL